MSSNKLNENFSKIENKCYPTNKNQNNAAKILFKKSSIINRTAQKSANANNDEINKFNSNFTYRKKFKVNKNFKIIKKINLFGEDKKEKTKQDKGKIPNKLNSSNNRKNKFNNFPLKNNRKFPKRNCTSKEIIKPSDDRRVNIKRDNTENINYLIQGALISYFNDDKKSNHINDNKKSNRMKELERKKRFLSEIGICYDTTYSNYSLPKKIEKNICDYKISKIIYTLNSNCIQSLKIIYKNRNNDSLITVENDDCLIENNKKHIIKFPDFLEIKLLGIEKDKDKDIGFTIQCGNEIYDIGYKQNSKSQKQINNKILLGIEMQACPSYGISNLNFKLYDSSKFAFQFYDGFLQLRAKLKSNLAFKNKILGNFNSFNEKQKLIINICNLPDLLFYFILKNLLII